MSQIEIIDVLQGTPEWLAARRGIPTASMYQTILTGGDGRRTYLRTLAGERMTEQPAESYKNEFMERGTTMEPEIRAYYEFTRNVEVQQVGFIRNGKTGCSPDGLIGEDGAVEFKSMAPHLLIPVLEAGTFPKKFWAQCQGVLMVTGRQWCDLVVYYPRMPKLLVRAERDEPYIGALRDAIDVFDLDLRRLVTRLKEM